MIVSKDHKISIRQQVLFVVSGASLVSSESWFICLLAPSPIELYDGTLFECQMLKNLLENEGIDSDLKDVIIGSRGGGLWRPAGGVKVIVLDENYDKAKKIVSKFEKSRETK
jgi:hypothetical protein